MYYAKEQMYREMPMTAEHAILLQDLNYPEGLPLHKDPFDRILLAQAKDMGAKLITADDKICNYREPCIFKLPEK